MSESSGHLAKDIAYDRESGEVFVYKFHNADFPSHKIPILPIYSRDLSPGYVHSRLSASELKEAYAQGLLAGRLKEIATNLDEDANPILVLVKFKE